MKPTPYEKPSCGEKQLSNYRFPLSGQSRKHTYQCDASQTIRKNVRLVPVLLARIPLKEFAEGGAAMADRSLLFGRKFGKGLAEGGEQEQRIVAEAARPAGCVQDAAVSLATESGERSAIVGRGDHADEARAAVGGLRE